MGSYQLFAFEKNSVILNFLRIYQCDAAKFTLRTYKNIIINGFMFLSGFSNTLKIAQLMAQRNFKSKLQEAFGCCVVFFSSLKLNDEDCVTFFNE